MNPSFFQPPAEMLLIAQSRIDALANGFQNQEPADYSIPLTVFGGLLAVAILGYACLCIRRWQAARIVNNSNKLFNELCRAHELSPGEKVSLVRLASARQLKDPCRLFIDGQLWMLDPTRDHELCKPKQRSILRRTRAKLFPGAGDFFDAPTAKAS